MQGYMNVFQARQNYNVGHLLNEKQQQQKEQNKNKVGGQNLGLSFQPKSTM